jgi:PTH2 family peptidyl-tRNA hydrolase
MQEEKNTKMVIVVRKFPSLRTGKYCSQVAHASMAFLTQKMNLQKTMGYGIHHHETRYLSQAYDEKQAIEITSWLTSSFRKICVYVNSEEELEAVHQKALDSGLISHMIVDNGATEFNGVKTKTCCAIGPASDHKFKNVTDHLPLL